LPYRLFVRALLSVRPSSVFQQNIKIGAAGHASSFHVQRAASRGQLPRQDRDLVAQRWGRAGPRVSVPGEPVMATPAVACNQWCFCLVSTMSSAIALRMKTKPYVGAPVQRRYALVRPLLYSDRRQPCRSILLLISEQMSNDRQRICAHHTRTFVHTTKYSPVARSRFAR